MSKNNLVKFDIPSTNVALDFFHGKIYQDNKSVERVYSFSNENLLYLFDYINLKNKRVLTVGSSGDQVLYSILFGCKDITLIDANPMTLPHLELKLAAIKNLSFEEFNEYFIKGQIFNREKYEKVKHDISDYSREFWESLMPENVNNKMAMRTLEKYFAQRSIYDSPFKKLSPIYTNKKGYEILKRNLEDCNIEFINEKFSKFDIALQSKGLFDYIHLSNIYDYVSKGSFVEKVKTLALNNLTKHGKIQLHYEFSPQNKKGLYMLKNLSEYMGKESINTTSHISYYDINLPIDIKGIEIVDLTYNNKSKEQGPLSILADRSYFQEKKKIGAIDLIKNLLSSENEDTIENRE